MKIKFSLYSSFKNPAGAEKGIYTIANSGIIDRIEFIDQRSSNKAFHQGCIKQTGVIVRHSVPWILSVCSGYKLRPGIRARSNTLLV